MADHRLVIDVENIGASHCGFVGAGLGHEPVRQARIGAADSVGFNTEEGVISARRLLFEGTSGKLTERLAQGLDIAIVNFLDGGKGFVGCFIGFGFIGLEKVQHGLL